ncbi:hypothetical protein VTP01DRAFT_4210 [Rhizomucor pusillus]|uniref:uncharacterized protein n=1 Tax=Rhizomucor pusillus TaxID=4840 RepID=UPI003743275C
MDISRLCSTEPPDVQASSRPSTPSSLSSTQLGNALPCPKPPSYTLLPVAESTTSLSITNANRNVAYPPSPKSVDSVAKTPPHQPQYTLPPILDIFSKTSSTYNIPHYATSKHDTNASIVNMLPSMNIQKSSSFDFGNILNNTSTPIGSISLPQPLGRATPSDIPQFPLLQINTTSSQQNQSIFATPSSNEQRTVQIIDIINLCTGLCSKLDKCRDRDTPSDLKVSLLESAARISKDILSNLSTLEASNRAQQQQNSRKRSASCLEPDDAGGERDIQKEDDDSEYAAIRQARMSQDSRPKYRRRTKRSTEGQRCHSCNTTETPEWRRGPDGARTLCNACGLHYSKLLRKGSLLVQTESKLLTQGSISASTSSQPSSQRIIHFPIIQCQGEYGENKQITTIPTVTTSTVSATSTTTNTAIKSHSSRFQSGTGVIDSARIKEID